ncbi:MAG: hypothetical protein H0X02_04950, partial [Nitrosomonas sp.]|nr:hypothetical protein [Nitrosomonas sp.]
MNTNTISAISASLLAIVFFPLSAITAHSDQNTSLPPAATSSADHTAVHKLIGGWPPRPQLAAQQMLAKYGVPQEASSE